MQENRPGEFKSGYNGLNGQQLQLTGSSLGFEIFLRIVFINLSLAQSN